MKVFGDLRFVRLEPVISTTNLKFNQLSYAISDYLLWYLWLVDGRLTLYWRNPSNPSAQGVSSRPYGLMDILATRAVYFPHPSGNCDREDYQLGTRVSYFHWSSSTYHEQLPKEMPLSSPGRSSSISAAKQDSVNFAASQYAAAYHMLNWR